MANHGWWLYDTWRRTGLHVFSVCLGCERQKKKCGDKRFNTCKSARFLKISEPRIAIHIAWKKLEPSCMFNTKVCPICLNACNTLRFWFLTSITGNMITEIMQKASDLVNAWANIRCWITLWVFSVGVCQFRYVCRRALERHLNILFAVQPVLAVYGLGHRLAFLCFIASFLLQCPKPPILKNDAYETAN